MSGRPRAPPPPLGGIGIRRGKRWCVHTRSRKGGTERNGVEREGGLTRPLSSLSLSLSLCPPRGRKIIVNLGGATPFTGPSSSPPRSRLLGFESSSRFGLTVSRVSLASCTGAGRSSGVELGGACEPQNSRRLTSRLSGYY